MSYKIFVRHHIKDVEEATPTSKSPTLVTKTIAIDFANAVKLFHFFIF